MTAPSGNRPTIDDLVHALEHRDSSLATLDHQHRVASVLGMEALGYDADGYLRTDRFSGPDADGAKVVTDATTKYLSESLNRIMNRASSAGFEIGRLPVDAQTRLFQGYFGVTPQGISQLVAEAKDKFTYETLVRAFEQPIQLAKQAIAQTPLTIANQLHRDEVLRYVGLTEGNPLYDCLRPKLEEVKPAHLLNLVDVYRNERVVSKPVLERLGLYNEPAQPVTPRH